MPDKPRKRGPYKKLLSMFEMDAIIRERAGSRIFSENEKGERTLEPWLKELRYNQAWEIAERIMGETIDEPTFQAMWGRTATVQKPKSHTEPPNTATFGGYRLRGRSALDRSQKQKPKKKK